MNWYLTHICIAEYLTKYEDDKEVFKKFEYKKIIEKVPETKKNTSIKPRNRIPNKRQKKIGEIKNKTRLVAIKSFIHNPKPITRAPPGYKKPNQLKRRPVLKSYLEKKNTEMT